MNERAARKLTLNWSVPGFIPVSPQFLKDEALLQVYEPLDHRQFLNAELAADYWSFPEILTEIRWLSQRVGQLDLPQDAGCFREFGGMNNTYARIQDSFRSIVSLLGYQSAQYHEANAAIEQVYQNKEKYIDFWKSWRYRLKWNHKPIRGLIPQRIQGLIEEFVQLSPPDQNPHFAEARRNALLLLDLAYSEWEIGDSVPENAVKCYEAFKKALRKFFREYLNQDEEVQAGRKLYQLAGWIKWVLNNYGQPLDFPETDKWDLRYRNAVWQGLQQIADCVCRQFQPQQEAPEDGFHLTGFHHGYHIQIRTAGGMMDLLNQTQKKLGKNDLQIKESRYLEACLKKLDLNCGTAKIRDKCVALLDLGEGEPLLSFSGYFDIPHTSDAQRIHDPLSEGNIPLEVFRKMANSLNWELVQVTDALAEYIYYKDTPSSQQSLIHALEAYQEQEKLLQNDPDSADKIKEAKGKLKSSYSCCERKLLGVLALNKKQPSAMKFYIKKKPCDKCDPVIEDWCKANNCIIEISTTESIATMQYPKTSST